ncbi:MAG: ArsR/SmtB family transcription factor [Candidatus Helarchaeota archaeon]
MTETTDLLIKDTKRSTILELNLEDPQTLTILKAISSKTRWHILKNLKNKLDVCQTAKKLKQTEANISAQIKILEKANLISPKYEAGRHGVRKFCQLIANEIIINI